MTFRGAYTALVTPFTPDGTALDLERLEEDIRFQAEGGVAGVVPCGTTGEAPTLQEDEYRAVIERSVEVARPLGLAVVAGTGSNCTAHAVAQQRFAAGAGADAGLQVVPYYNKPSQEGLYRHFNSVADSCELPLVLYNIPGRSGVGLTADTVERLSRHPNIRAIKEASGSLELASEIVRRTGLAVLSGDDPLTLPLASVGAVGVISVLSNLLPGEVAGMCGAFLAGDFGAAREIHLRVVDLARGLLTLGTNPVPVKAAMALLARDTGAVRLPLCPLDEAARRRLADLLDAAGLTRRRGAEVVAAASRPAGTRR